MSDNNTTVLLSDNHINHTFLIFLMKKSLKKIAIVPLLIVVFSPLAVLAATAPSQTIIIPNPLNVEDFQGLIEVIITAIFNVALWIAPLLIIISGFYWLTAAEDPKKVQTAKDIIKYTIIGLIIIIASKGIISFFQEIFQVK